MSKNLKHNKAGGNTPPPVQYGSTLPQATNIERAVLGAMMLDKTAPFLVIPILHEEMFYAEANRIIFEAIYKLYEKNDPVDLLTVTDKIKSMGLLDKVTPYYIVEVTRGVASAANVEYHCRILAQFYMKRATWQVGHIMSQQALDDSTDPFEVYDKSVNSLRLIQSKAITSRIVRSKDLMDSAVDELLAVHKIGIDTGLPSLDNIINKRGLQGGHVCVVSGVAGTGKTSFVLQIAIRHARNGKKVKFFSYEMTAAELMLRILCFLAGINKNDYYDIPDEERASHPYTQLIYKARDESQDWINNIIIEEDGSLNAPRARSVLIQSKMQDDIDLAIFDYLQLMPYVDPRKDEKFNVNETMKILKNTAKQIKLPIIMLSQLNRDCLRNPYGKPKNHNLIGSSAIENTADQIILLWRPHYIGYPTVDGSVLAMKGIDRDKEYLTSGKAFACVTKNRHGKVGDACLRFIGFCTKFMDVEDCLEADYENPDFTSFQEVSSEVGNNIDENIATFGGGTFNVPSNKSNHWIDDEDDTPF